MQLWDWTQSFGYATALPWQGILSAEQSPKTLMLLLDHTRHILACAQDKPAYCTCTGRIPVILRQAENAPLPA